MNTPRPTNRLRQVLAIARTEFLFGVRRPGPAFLALVGSLAVVLGTVIACLDAIPDERECVQVFEEVLADPAIVEQMILAGNPPTTAEEMCAAIMAEWYAENAEASIAQGIEQTWFPFLLFGLVFVSAAAAPAVPADRQYGASGWLVALPIDANTYLAGKVLGLFLSALAGATIPLLVFIPLTLILMHTLPAGLMLALAALAGLPVLLWSVSFGVLSGVIFRNRMKAAMAGVVLGLFCLIAWLHFFVTPYGPGSTSDTAAYFVFQQFRYEANMPWQLTAWHVVRMYLVLLAAGLLLWFAARGWLRWKENF